MRISITGTEKVNLKGLLGANRVNIKAITGDFHFVEVKSENKDDFVVRDVQDVLNVTEVISQGGGELVVKVVNAEVLKMRPKEHLMVKNSSSEIVGYIQFKSSEVVDVTYQNLTFFYESSTPEESFSGLCMEGNFTTSHSIVLLEDSLLEEDDSLENVSSIEYNYLFIKGTGVIEISPLKKKD